MKKIYNFPEESELLKFITYGENLLAYFFAVSGVEMKNLQRSEQAHFVLPSFALTSRFGGVLGAKHRFFSTKLKREIPAIGKVLATCQLYFL